jgi:hypothetical protein
MQLSYILLDYTEMLQMSVSVYQQKQCIKAPKYYQAYNP